MLCIEVSLVDYLVGLFVGCWIVVLGCIVVMLYCVQGDVVGVVDIQCVVGIDGDVVGVDFVQVWCV